MTSHRPTEPEVEVLLDRPRVLRLDFNALAAIEDDLGFNLMMQEVDLKTLKMGAIIRFIWFLLRDDDPDLTEREVGRLLHPGSLQTLMVKLGELQQKAVGSMGEAMEAAVQAGAATPPEDSAGSISGPSADSTSD